MILQRTGAYSHAVSGCWHPEQDWYPETWQSGIERLAEAWSGFTNLGLTSTEASEEGKLAKKFLQGRWTGNTAQIESFLPALYNVNSPMAARRRIQLLKALQRFGKVIDDFNKLSESITVSDLRGLSAGAVEREPEEVERIKDLRRFADALLTLHAAADQACQGFGFLSPVSPRRAVAHGFANLLLTATGSVSTISKCFGTVLPKMRTPQVGLTLRSMSHHLTFHCTEVEVIWRTLPWPNTHENTVNLLAIPWPRKVREQSFEPSRNRGGRDRYFRFDPSMKGAEEGQFRPEEVLELIQNVERDQGRVHAVVLPELSISDRDFEALLSILAERYRDDGGPLGSVPLVIAGVLNTDPKGRDRPNGEVANEVRMASYVAGRWYVLSQRKHHRWRLDGGQIRQYGMAGKLSTSRGWWEDHAVTQRRLTFFCPNAWLTLCPLICEDLARLEPVSEVIRGVGPTVLIALLLDGPQVDHRWSARYASVFADDPGSAVLSLSSIGMIERSRPQNRGPIDPRVQRTVALWRDPINLSRLIELDEGHDAVLLTLAAEWREEFTADGRSDGQNASAFRLEGTKCYSLCPDSKPCPDREIPAASPPKTASWADMRELSAVTFAIYSSIWLALGDRYRHVETLIDWLEDQPEVTSQSLSLYAEHQKLLRAALKDPIRTGTVAPAGDKWGTDSLHQGSQLFRLVFREGSETGAYEGEPEEVIRFFIRKGSEILQESSLRRADYVFALTLLSVLHAICEEESQARDGISAIPPRVAARLNAEVQLALSHDRRLDLDD